jgi:predicted phosphodiesterase
MRVAVVSDIHGNLTALEAVIADIEHAGVDLVVHGGDVLGSGARQAEVVDRLRDLNWPGVYGNADEMLWNPDRVAAQLQAPAHHRVRDIVLAQAADTVNAIGDERLTWLRALPRRWVEGALTVVHASPDDVWRSPSPESPDEELVTTYGPLASRRVVYGHIHRAFVRRLPSFILANSGSVSLSYDRDPRAAYALVDDNGITIRRVEYDIEREVTMLADARFPGAAWVAAMLRAGSYLPPPDGPAEDGR